jgi:uncharacterized protein (TIGR00251 family)
MGQMRGSEITKKIMAGGWNVSASRYPVEWEQERKRIGIRRAVARVLRLTTLFTISYHKTPQLCGELELHPEKAADSIARIPRSETAGAVIGRLPCEPVLLTLLRKPPLCQMRRIQVKVKPNSRISSLEEKVDGPWFAQLKAPPVDGKANQELVALIAEHFRCSKSAVSIKTGKSSRIKLVQIEGD